MIESDSFMSLCLFLPELRLVEHLENYVDCMMYPCKEFDDGLSITLSNMVNNYRSTAWPWLWFERWESGCWLLLPIVPGLIIVAFCFLPSLCSTSQPLYPSSRADPFRSFVDCCLLKIPQDRPSSGELLRVSALPVISDTSLPVSVSQRPSGCVNPKWYPIHYIVHYFWPEPCG